MSEGVADTRSRREKLLAMAGQTEASPREAEIAARVLASLPRPRTLSREDIMAAPDLRAGVETRRVWNPALRVHVVMDVDDPAYLDSILDAEGP